LIYVNKPGICGALTRVTRNSCYITRR